jgi:hypothetical protein
MPDPLNALLEKLHAPAWLKSVVDHNRGLFSVIAVGCVLAAIACGCQPKTVSPFTGKMVSRIELEAQIAQCQLEHEAKLAALKAAIAIDELKAEASFALLEAQENAIKSGLQILGQAVQQTVPAPWNGMATTLLGAATLAIGIDNRRKDAVIKSTKLQRRLQA